MAPFTRQSKGFEQFTGSLQISESLSILDLAGASQANISFITNLGHRISSEDVVSAIAQYFGPGNDLEAQYSASAAHRFFEQLLSFPDASFDGALVWDTLQFLPSPVLEQTVDRLLRVMRPGGLILAFFHADEKTTSIPVYSYRIQDPKTLLLTPTGGNRKVRHYNNRSIERMFEKSHSLKFFLTRDHLREVIVRR
jgi:SAM-dependent methyltransferase